MFKRYPVVGLIFILMFMLVPGQAPVNAVAAPADGWTRFPDLLVASSSISHLIMAPSNPDILYAFQAGPFYAPTTQRLVRSQDGGSTWQIQPDTNHIFKSLAVDPEDPDMLYAIDNSQLWKSTDAGLNWAVLFLYPFGMEVLAPAPGRIYLAESFGFTRSLDGGVTWETSQWNFSGTLDYLKVSPGNPDQIFAILFISVRTYSGYEPIYSLDGGTTWQELKVNGYSFEVIHIAIDELNPDNIYFWGAGVMWTTDDNMETWSQCGWLPVKYNLLLLAMGDQLFAVSMYGSPYFYKSEDHCATWWQSVTPLPAPVKSLIGDTRPPERLLVATDGFGILSSTNHGWTWQKNNTGLSTPAEVSKLAVTPSDPNVILAVDKDLRPGVYRSADGGLTWSPAVLNIDPISITIHPLDPQKAWIITSDRIYSTEDGSHWTFTLISTPISLFDYIVTDMTVSQASPDFPFIAYSLIFDTTQAYIMQINNNKNFQAADLRSIQTLAVNPWDANDLLAGGINEAVSPPSHSVIYRTQDGGKTWHQVLATSYPTIAIVIDPNNPQNRYLLTGKEGIKRSTDGGETWADWSGAMAWPSITSGSLAVDDLGGVYAFTPGKIQYRAKDGANWQIIPTDFRSSDTGILWRGSAPFLLSSGPDGLWKKDLPPIHKTWLPALSK